MRSSLREAPPVRRGLAARDEHNCRRSELLSKQLRHRETILTWQLNVQENDLGAKPRDLPDRRQSVASLTNYIETLRLQHGPSRRTEIGVIIDDQ